MHTLRNSRVRAGLAASMCLAMGLSLASCARDSETQDTAAAVSMKTDSSSAAPGDAKNQKTEKATLDTDPAPGGDFSFGPAEAAQADASYLSIEDVRIGSHDGYDRIVFEFGGEGKPGYFIRYEDIPAQQASGKPISVDGSPKLSVDLRGIGYPFDFEKTDYPSGPVRPEKTSGVNEVVGAGTFEGQSQYVVGMKGEKLRYKVFTLSNPTRLVIDFEAK